MSGIRRVNGIFVLLALVAGVIIGAYAGTQYLAGEISLPMDIDKLEIKKYYFVKGGYAIRLETDLVRSWNRKVSWGELQAFKTKMEQAVEILRNAGYEPKYASQFDFEKTEKIVIDVYHRYDAKCAELTNFYWSKMFLAPRFNSFLKNKDPKYDEKFLESLDQLIRKIEDFKLDLLDMLREENSDPLYRNDI